MGGATVNLTDNSTLWNHTVGNHTNHTGDHNDEHEHDFKPTIIIFIFGGMLIGALIRTFLKKFALPYTVWLFLFGGVLGIVSSKVSVVAEYTTMARLDPHVILLIFMPIIIFESAFSMEVHTFVKAINQIAILASLGLVISTVMTGVFAMNVFQYGWGWGISLTFGSMISATDPVAIVSLMREIGANEKLMTIIEGESLMNDGAAIILFNIFRSIAKGDNPSASAVVLYLVQVIFGGTLLGFFIGKVSLFWLVNLFNDALTEITITLAATYITFYLGEVSFQISGVLAVVVLGLTINAERTSISPEVETFLHRFWEMLAFLSNTLIFILVGVVIVERSINNITGTDLILILALYGAISFIRVTTILILSPLLRKCGYGLPWKWAAVLTWGGLRGAVSLLLALLLIKTQGIDDTGTVQDKILVHTSGIVLLTLLINGTTCHIVLQYLGLSDISGPKKQAVALAIRTLNEVTENMLESYKTDGFLADAEWPIVIKCVHMQDPYSNDMNHDGEGIDEFMDKYSKCPKCESEVANELSKKDLFELKEEARLRLLKALKTSYMSQFEHGVLSRMAVRRLLECVDSAADQVDGMIEVKDIKKTWQIPRIYQWMTRKLHQWEASKEERVTIIKPKHKFRRAMFVICEHYAFTIFINLIILINAVAIVTEYVFEGQECGAKMDQYEKIFRSINYAFLVIYLLEAILKITAHLQMYFKSKWNIFDFVILIFSMVDLIVDLTIFIDLVSTCFGEEEENSNIPDIKFSPSVFRIAKTIRFLRIIRSLRLVKSLVPHLQALVNGRINNQLRLAYDVGKGYVVGQQEVSHFVGLIVDNKLISDEFKIRVDQGKTEIIKALGIIQKEHPGIAVSVKTQQAARQILNSLRDKINELRSEGVLDESEAEKIDMTIEIKMKKLLWLPKTIPPSSPERVISDLSWAVGDPVLIQYLKVNAELHSMVEGEVLQSAETPEGGLYIIVSGLVKVEGAMIDNTNYTYKSMGDVQGLGSDAVAQLSLPNTMSDFYTTGSVLGEYSLLTGAPMNVEVLCETSAQLYHISHEAIKAALELLMDKPSLEYRMWKVLGKRLGLKILERQLMYRSWTSDSLKQHMERSEILIHKFNLDKSARIVEISAVHISDVILLHGEAQIEATGQIVEGPCYIPPSIESHLELLGTKTDKHVILVVLRSTENIIPGNNAVLSLESDGSRPSVLALHAHRKTGNSPSRLQKPSQTSVTSKTLIVKKSSLLRSNQVSPMFEIITDREEQDSSCKHQRRGSKAKSRKHLKRHSRVKVQEQTEEIIPQQTEATTDNASMIPLLPTNQPAVESNEPGLPKPLASVIEVQESDSLTEIVKSEGKKKRKSTAL